MNDSQNVPQISVPKIGQTIEFRDYVVGFFDILGQREHLQKMGPIPTTKQQEAEFCRRTGATLGAIRTFRTVFNEYFENYLQAEPPDFVSNLPNSERTRVLESSDVEVSFQGFSDTLIVYLPVVNRHGRYQWRGIHAILAACATLMPMLLREGIPVRGALDMGVGVEFVPGEIYGPILQHTYHLESKVAEYPRIVVGTNMEAHLRKHTPSCISTATNGANIEVHDKHTQWLGVDDDKITIVDYLGISAKSMTGGFTRELVAAAYIWICTELEQFKKSGNNKLGSRYERLKGYYVSRCPDLAINHHPAEESSLTFGSE